MAFVREELYIVEVLARVIKEMLQTFQDCLVHLYSKI